MNNDDIFKEQAQREADEVMKEMRERDKEHTCDDPDEPIKEKQFAENCEKCGCHLFTEAKSLDFETREVFGSGYKVIKMEDAYVCPTCLVNILWDKGKQNLNLKEEFMEDRNLVAKEAIVMPAVTAEKALAAWNIYQDLKKKVVESSDIQKIQGKEFLKKSYWRKIATFFNLSVEIVEERTETANYDGVNVLVYHFRARVTHDNGRFAEGTGSCDIYDHATLLGGKFMIWDKYKKVFKEAEPKSIHTARTTAETRAWNRAVSNLVGGGEVSAEEIKEDARETNGEYIEDTPQPALTISQALTKVKGDVFNVMGIVQDTKERKTKKGVDVTDYFITSTDSEEKMVIARYGTTHHGLKQGMLLIFKEVTVHEFNDALSYLAKEIEIVGK